MKKTIISALLCVSATANAQMGNLLPYDTEYQFGFYSNIYTKDGNISPPANEYFVKNRAAATYWCVGQFSEAFYSCYKAWYGLFKSPLMAARFIVHLEDDRRGQPRRNVAICHTQTDSCRHDIGDAADDWTTDLNVMSPAEMLVRMNSRNDFFHIYVQHPVAKTWRWHSVYDVGAVGVPDELCQHLAPGEQFKFNFSVPKGTGMSLLWDVGTIAYNQDELPIVLDGKLDHRYDISYPVGQQGECSKMLDGSQICKPTFSDYNLRHWQDNVFEGNKMNRKFVWRARYHQYNNPQPVDEFTGEAFGCFIIDQGA